MIAKGVVFETNTDDEAYAVVDDRLAPKGYEYIAERIGRRNDLRNVLRKAYNSSPLKAALFPLAAAIGQRF